MIRCAGRLVLLGLLVGCEPQGTAPPRVAAVPCGSDRVVVDRGIGGTGAATGPKTADRGIGGTGIVGVVTGFGSVCVNGLELALAPTAQVTIDGLPARAAELRVADVVAVTAAGAAPNLIAGTVAVRHEVVGPVNWLAPDRAEAEVAGQPVRLEPTLRDTTGLHVGDWVAVSGLRDPTGIIHATRLDPRSPGEVTVVGRLDRTRGEWRIGTLGVRFAQGSPPAAPRLRLTGRLLAGRLQVATAAVEPLLPAGNHPQRLSIEGFVDTTDGRLHLGEAVAAAIAPDFGAPPAPDRLAIVEFVDTQGAGLVALHWHPAVSHHAAGAAAGGGDASAGEVNSGGASSGEASSGGAGESGQGSGESNGGGGGSSGHSTGHGEGGGSGSGGGGSGH